MKRSWAIPALAAATTFAIFLPVLDFFFVGWDDPIHFLDVPHYRGLAWENIRWMFSSLHLGLYQPLSWLSLAVDFKIWGLDPFGHHLTNLLLHSANAAFVYLISRGLLKQAVPGAGEDDLSIASLAAALFFALHPLRVEAVAWVTQRRELLAAFFALGATLAYLRWLKDQKFISLGISLALFCAGLLSKATVMCVPLAFLIIDIFPYRRTGRPRLMEKLPFFAASFAAGFLALYGQVVKSQIAGFSEFGIAARICQSVYGLMFYVVKTLLPIHLLPFYPFPQPFNPLAPNFIAAFAGLTLLLGVLLYFYKHRSSAPTWAFAAYVVLSAPIIGLAKTGDHLAADRFTYLPCLPLALLAGGGLLILLRSKRRLPAVAFSFAALVILAGMSRLQASIWRDSKSLWTHTLSIDPNHAVAHNSLATAFAEEGRFKEAAEHCREAARLKPDFTRAWDNLGRALIHLRRWEEALEAYRSALAVSPNDAALHANEGLALAGAGRLRDAALSYNRSLALSPNAPGVHYNLGVALLRLGLNSYALFSFERAGELGMNSADLSNNRGLALARLGRLREAEKEFRGALVSGPNAQAHFNLSRLFDLLGRKSDARLQLREARRLDPSVGR